MLRALTKLASLLKRTKKTLLPKRSKKDQHSFIMESCCRELDSTRRSTVLNLPFHKDSLQWALIIATVKSNNPVTFVDVLVKFFKAACFVKK